MANRFFNNVRKAMEKETVSLFAQVTIAAAGVPTLVVANSKAVKSIVRNGVGLYTVTLGLSSGGTPFAQTVDTYIKLFNVNATFLSAGAPAAPIYNLVAATPASGTFQIQFRDAANAAADPGNGEVLYMSIDMGNSTAI